MGKALTIQQIAHNYGYSQGFVRSACHRAPHHHPLPHIEHGETRPVIYIRPEVFEKWLREEECLNAGVPDVTADKSLQECLNDMRDAWEKFEAEIDRIIA